MIEQRDDRHAATPAGRSSSEWEGQRDIASPPESTTALVGTFTAYERALTWCVLTLLSTRGTPPPGKPTLTGNMPDRSPSLSLEGSRLTAREIEVLGLVALGLTNVQIAARLFVSHRTIDQHLSSIYNRLGVSSRAAATRYAILNDLC